MALIRAICKLLAVVLAVTILLIGAIAHVVAINVIWAAVPLLFLGGTDVGYAVLEEKSVASEEPRDSKGSPVLPVEAVGSKLGRFLRATASLAIWPFYLGLVGVIIAGGAAIRPPTKEEAPVLYPMQGPQQPYRLLPGGPVPGASQFPSPLSRSVAVPRATTVPRTSPSAAATIPSSSVRPSSGTPSGGPAK